RRTVEKHLPRPGTPSGPRAAAVAPPSPKGACTAVFPLEKIARRRRTSVARLENSYSGFLCPLLLLALLDRRTSRKEVPRARSDVPPVGRGMGRRARAGLRRGRRARVTGEETWTLTVGKTEFPPGRAERGTRWRKAQKSEEDHCKGETRCARKVWLWPWRPCWCGLPRFRPLPWPKSLSRRFRPLPLPKSLSRMFPAITGPMKRWRRFARPG